MSIELMRPARLCTLLLIGCGCSPTAPIRPMPAALDPASTSSPISDEPPPPNPLSGEVPDAITNSASGAPPTPGEARPKPRSASGEER